MTTNNTPASNNTNATVNFRAPIKTTANFNAPINIEIKAELPKVTAADLACYFAEATKGQCETVNPRPGTPGLAKPAKRENDCERIDTPIRDREKCANLPAPKCNTPTNNLAGDRCGTDLKIAEEIYMEILKEHPHWSRSDFYSCVRFASCYEMYAVGTRHDVTFTVRRFKDGSYQIKKNIW